MGTDANVAFYVSVLQVSQSQAHIIVNIIVNIVIYTRYKYNIIRLFSYLLSIIILLTVLQFSDKKYLDLKSIKAMKNCCLLCSRLIAET